MLDALLDALLDSLKILPFLFVTYIILEYLESRAEDRIRDVVKQAGWTGPFWGSILGALPQCGFSAAASNLYAGRTISLGTLIAIFLSTSDEMMPVMISQSVPVNRMAKLLITKVIIAMITGFLIDGIRRTVSGRKTGLRNGGEDFQIERLCEKEHCHCENGSIILSAIKHTMHIFLFVIGITFFLNLAFLFLGEEELTSAISSQPVLGLFLSALVGLIPNCGASIILTQMYLQGLIPVSHLMAGLLDGAGVGLLILFRVNPDIRENLRITGILYLLAVLFGLFLYALGYTV